MDFEITIQKNVGADPIAHCTKWDSFVRRIKKTEYGYSDMDKITSAFLGSKMKPRVQWTRREKPDGSFSGYRIIENIESISVAVMDLDYKKNADPKEEMAYLRNLLEDCLGSFNYILYPTFSHSQEMPAYRLVIPLKQPIRADNWLHYWEMLAASTNADRQCKDVTRLYYFPVVDKRKWPNEDPAIEINEPGRFMMPQDIEKIHSLLMSGDHKNSDRYQEIYQSVVCQRKSQKTIDGKAIPDYVSLSIDGDSADFSATGLLPQDFDYAITWCKRDPTVISNLRERYRENIGNHYFALKIAQGLLNKYGPKQFTYRHFSEMTSDFLHELPSGESSDTLEQLPTIYESALNYWARDNHVTLKQKAEEFPREISRSQQRKSYARF